MSEMEVFIGTFHQSDRTDIVPEDTDDFYDLEEELGVHFVRVGGTLYEFSSIANVDQYGFSVVLNPNPKPIIVCYWYNGGGGLHEVVARAIEQYAVGW